MDFRELIRGAGEIVGLEGLEPDENNICHFVSEDMTITVEWMEEYGSVLMSAPVCRIPSEYSNDTALMRAIAAANFQYKQTSGSTISVDPESDYVYIFRYDRCFDWEPADLLDLVERMALGVDRVRKLISDYGVQPELPTEDTKFLLGSGFVLA